jgi:pimeloyl-ACP methyl ester carboxylesterase
MVLQKADARGNFIGPDSIRAIICVNYPVLAQAYVYLSTMRNLLKIGGILLAIPLLLISLLVLVGVYYSPGTTPAFTDAAGRPLPNSIASSEKVVLGGVEQWILIRGSNQAKPLLLFLHGGPGSPEAPMFRAFNQALEEHFVVVHWDQRGTGKSYAAAIPDSTFTIKQFVQDTHELVALLRQRFGQEKIWLMGHSWGSVLGVLAVQHNPAPFRAYIGIGQVANMQEGERISYNYVLQTAHASGNQKAVQELQAIGMPPYETGDWMESIMKERNWVTHFGGAWYGKEDMMDIVWPILKAEEYTLGDKINYLRGAYRSLNLLWPELMEIDLIRQAPELGVPVYIFQGVHDYQTPYVLARQYFQQLKAPRKKLFTFSNTAHSPIYEHPQTFHRLLLEEVLPDAAPAQGRNRQLLAE